MANPTTDSDRGSAGSRAPRTRRLLSGSVALALLAAGGTLRAADAVPGERWCGVPDGDGIAREVDRIEFAGNRVTRPEVLERELVQRRGEICSLDDIIDGIQSLMDLGLFRSVRAELSLERRAFAVGGDFTGEVLVLRYIVREKLFFLAIPRFSRTADGELRTGLQLRWDNFSGRLHELRLTVERRQEDDGRGHDGYVRSLEYRVPRFFGTPWGAEVELGVESRRTTLSRESETFGEGRRESTRVVFGMARWLGRSLGVQGWRARAGIGLERREIELTEGERGPIADGLDASVVVGVEKLAVNEDSYRRRGHRFGASVRVAGDWTGSDFAYHRMDLRYLRYRPLDGGIRNLNLQARLGFSDGAPFGIEAYDIGGGELLRGVAPGRDVGDVLAVVNIEYLAAFFTRPEWRRVLFVDIGNVYPRERIRPLALNLRLGVGLRYKLRALTRTDLRLDVGWDPDEGRPVTFFATSLAF